jgi:hypothetical protein
VSSRFGNGVESGRIEDRDEAALVQAADIGDLIREGKLLEVQLRRMPAGTGSPRSASIGRCRLVSGLLSETEHSLCLRCFG